MTEKTVDIWTDGACVPNPGNGGWAAIVRREGLPSEELSGHVPDTTNNRMEVLSVIRGLQALAVPSSVTIYSDSRYVVDAIGAWLRGKPVHSRRGWIVGWRMSGWRRKKGEIKNLDLWKQVSALVRSHERVELIWVRGHSGHEANERCDFLAGQHACPTTARYLPPGSA